MHTFLLPLMCLIMYKCLCLPFLQTRSNAARNSVPIIWVSIFPTLHSYNNSASLPLFLHLVMHTCFCFPIPQTWSHAATGSVYILCISIFPTMHPCSTLASLPLWSAPNLEYMFVSLISPDLHPCSTVLGSDTFHLHLSYTAFMKHLRPIPTVF